VGSRRETRAHIAFVMLVVVAFVRWVVHCGWCRVGGGAAPPDVD